MQTLQDAQPSTGRFREKREAILAAAASLFNQHGIRGTTLSDIAAQVGLITSSVTYYYRKKEDLALACFLRSASAHEQLAREAAEEPTVAARVRRLFALHAEVIGALMRGERPPLIWFNDIRALPEAQEQTAFAAYNDLFRSVRRLLKPAPQLSPQELNARAHLLISQVNFVGAWIGRHEVEQFPRVARATADLLLQGLAGPGAVLALGDSVPRREPASVNGDARSEAFLRVATELVNDKGYRGASVDAIAARINLTKGSFYADNDTKLDLVTACFERTFALVRGALAAAETADGSAWQRLGTAIAGLVRFQLSDEGPLLRTSAEIALPDEAHRMSVRRTHRQLTERLALLVVEGIVDGSIRPCNAAIAAQLLSCAVNAAAELPRWVQGITAETVTELYTRPVLLGLESASAG